MDPLKRSQAKKAKSTEAADMTTTYKVVGEHTDNGCPGPTSRESYFSWSRLVFVQPECAGRRQVLPFALGVTAKKQTKLICVVCSRPVNGAISIGKKLEGGLTRRRGKAE